MTYAETLDYLYTTTPSFQSVGADAYKPGLERVSAFCRHLGNPQRDYLTIHIAGTNGKGSVSNMLCSILMHAGYRVGLFTSPHLKDFRERMRVSSEMISEREVVDFVARHRQTMQQLDLSFFEMTTAMAFDFFSRQDVEVAIIETGLGGRLDATNIITPILSLVTNIGLDHTDLLGDTLQAIAAEKAGIAKRGVAMILGEGSEEYNSVFEQHTSRIGSQLIYAEPQFVCSAEGQRIHLERLRDGHRFTFDLDLEGDYQLKNVVTAAAAADYLHEHTPITICKKAFLEGLSSVCATTAFAGRWQRLSSSPLTICDTGHNAHGIRYVAKQLQRVMSQHNRLFCVIGFVRDKDVEEVLRLLPRDAHYIFTQAQTKRALPAQELATLAERAGLRGEVVANAEEALTQARKQATADDVIFIGGSNYVVSEIL